MSPRTDERKNQANSTPAPARAISSALEHLTGEIRERVASAVNEGLELLTTMDADGEWGAFVVRMLVELQHVKNCSTEIDRLANETGGES